jgi:hypothetical protein
MNDLLWFIIGQLLALLGGWRIPSGAFVLTASSGDLLVVKGMVRGQRTLPLERLREIEVIRAQPSGLERGLYRTGYQPAGWVRYNFVFVDDSVELPKQLGDGVFERVHDWNPWIPILDRDESQQLGIPRPVYDTVGWEQLLAAVTDELSPETQIWVRNELASRQRPGKLLAAVVGSRARHPDLSLEPAAILVYPEVILATSGYGTGESRFLRPGDKHVFDTVVKDEQLVEVTTLNLHIVDLKPVAGTAAALQALRSLPWIQVREAPTVDVDLTACVDHDEGGERKAST